MGTTKLLAVMTAGVLSLSAAPTDVPALQSPNPIAQTSDQQSPVTVHSPPVDAPIVDPFRAPEHEFGPGNRGIEYATTPGQPVRASAAGVVSFAGQVGGNLFVTIDHGDGLRTTVGFVDEALVNVGTAVDAGALIGSAGPTTHFSARRNGEYFDPELLFVGFRIAVRLVAGP